MYSVYAFLCCALLALSTAAEWSHNCTPCVCYQSGSLLRAECDNNELTFVPVLPNDTQHIYIEDGNISSLNATEFDTYPHLTQIRIQNNPFTVLPIGLFSKPKNLTHINLSYNKLKLLNSYSFANLIYLEEVWLDRNQIAVLQDNCFFNVPKLNKLSLGNNHLSKININFIDNFNGLQYLYFTDNPVHCDDSMCALMNRVVERRMWDLWRSEPTCSSPPSVRNMNWTEAMGALWGAGLEHCPHPAVVEMNQTLKEEVRVVKEPVSTGTDEMPGLKEAVVQLLAKSHALFMEELNKTMTEVKDGQQKLKDSVNVLVRQNEQIIHQTDTLQSPHILFKEVLHVSGNSSGQGFLKLMYSILPALRNASADL